MHRPALGMLAALAAVSCGSGRPPFDAPDDPKAADASGGADARHDADAGIRLLSDVTLPREIDGRAGAADRDARSDGPRDAPGDVSFEGDRSIATADAIEERRNFDANEERLDADANEEREAAAVDAHGDAGKDDVDAVALDHLLITEVVTRPKGAEMIEIANLTGASVDLSDYFLSDSHLYWQIALGTFTTASGSDFVARFPDGATILPGQYVVVALGNASGGSASFEATFGTKPDFELRPSANGASDDPSVPNMQSAQPGTSIGATASLTDAGEPIILFSYRGGPLVSDVDYLFFGEPSASNLVVDKTGLVVAGAEYRGDTPDFAQHHAPAPPEGGSLHRCGGAEIGEKLVGGNGLTGHDETSEDASKAFTLATIAADRTPGRPPPNGLCTGELGGEFPKNER